MNLEVHIADGLGSVISELSLEQTQAWELWLHLFNTYKVQLTYAQRRIERYIYAVLPEVNDNDVFLKAFCDGYSVLWLYRAYKSDMRTALGANKQEVFAFGECRVSPFVQYHNAAQHVESDVAREAFPYVWYLPQKWLQLKAQQLLETIEEIQGLFIKHSFLTGHIDWKEIRQHTSLPITRKKLQRVLADRYHLDNITNDFGRVCAYIVLRQLDVVGEEVAIETVMQQFVEFIEEDMLLLVNGESNG